MGNAEIYRKRAKECGVLADGNTTPEHRTAWLDLEQSWLRLARDLELYQEVDPFVAFAQTRARRTSAR